MKPAPRAATEARQRDGNDKRRLETLETFIFDGR